VARILLPAGHRVKNDFSHKLDIDARTSVLDALREHMTSKARKKAATMGNAGLARCSSMAVESTRA
jgi:aerobic-type carbon monoxide dehydrogenase small subunit (CoxS/CutS family)